VDLLKPADLGFDVLFELIRDAVVVADVESERICLWNSAAVEMFGYSADEAVGLPLETLVPEELRDAHHTGIAGYLATGRGTLTDIGVVVTVPAVRADGTRLMVDLRLSPLRQPPQHGAPGTFVMALIRDVDEREALARGLAEANGSLRMALQTEQASSANLARLIALKDDFLAILSHDLASPLTSVRGNANLLRRSWDRLDLAQREHSLEVIENTATRMAALVRDLLDAALLDAGALPYDVQPIDLVASLHQVITEMGAAGDRITLAAPGQACLALADAARHSQIATNLLTNALKYSPPQSPVEMSLEPAPGGFAVSVRDHGAGIPADQVDEVFDRFHRRPEHRLTQGTGLGLYITRRLVEEQGGTITVLQPAGGGALFRYTLPSAPDVAPD